MEPDQAAWAVDRFGLHPVAAFNQPVGLDSFWEQSWVGHDRDRVPTGAQPRRGAPAPLRRKVRPKLARTRYRPLADAQHAGRTDQPDPRWLTLASQACQRHP
ncbi:MAG: hypothetical protein OXD50_03340 [Chloroflexi bacterium]|nr:hypothetical protein [Chloroflexota bacterium]